METQDFVKNFAELFEGTETSNIKMETKFKEIEGWSSLILLFIIGMVDEKYETKIKGEDILKCQTVGEIFNIVKSKSQIR